MFIFSTDYDTSMCRKISDGNLCGQSDDPRGAYSLKIKMGCWEENGAEHRK